MAKKVKAEADMTGAIKEGFLLAVGGDWFEAKKLKDVAKKHHVTYSALVDELELGESDSGKYLIDDSFNDGEIKVAPDEK